VHEIMGKCIAVAGEVPFGLGPVRADDVSLQTEADNIPALRLYTAAGFQPVGGLELLSLTLTPGKHQDSPGRRWFGRLTRPARDYPSG
jgi:hypothetical protein